MFFSFKRGRIHYSDSGNGPVVVLLHGYLESSEVWNGFAEKLASEFRVISVNLPVNAKVIVLKKSGHLGFIEEEENSLRAIKEFVGKIS